jgi:hypothetical protein
MEVLDTLMAPMDLFQAQTGTVISVNSSSSQSCSFEKGQFPRVIDVVILGPFMMWFAFYSKSVPMWARIFMCFAGFYTIVFNARNYLRNEVVEMGCKNSQTFQTPLTQECEGTSSSTSPRM